MKANGKQITVIILCVLSAVVLICGVVWSITQGVRGAAYRKTEAEVIKCETQQIDGAEVIVKVLVTFEADGKTYENVSYIGDLSRCRQGMKMKVYYLAEAPAEYVYSKPGDLGFALIMTAGGAFWLVISAVLAVCMKKAGYFSTE